MGFLKKLFGRNETTLGGAYTDKHGLYFHFQCDHCGALVRVRADKQHDLLNEGNGYVWHKTVVDNKCFRRMQTAVSLDAQYAITNYEVKGGQLLSQLQYEALLAAATAVEPAATDEETPSDDQ